MPKQVLAPSLYNMVTFSMIFKSTLQPLVLKIENKEARLEIRNQLKFRNLLDKKEGEKPNLVIVKINKPEESSGVSRKYKTIATINRETGIVEINKNIEEEEVLISETGDRRYDKVRYDKVRYDKVRYDKVRYDKVRYDKVRYDKVRYDKVRYDKVRYDKVRYDKVRYDKVRYDKVRYDKVCTLNYLIES